MIAHSAVATAEQAAFTPYSPSNLSLEMDENTRNELAVLMLNELPELIRNRQEKLAGFQVRAEKLRQTAYFTASKHATPTFAVDVQEDIACDPSYTETVLSTIAEKILDLTVDCDYLGDSAIDEIDTPDKMAVDSVLSRLLVEQTFIQDYAKLIMVNQSWSQIMKQDLDFMIATYNKLCMMSPLPQEEEEHVQAAIKRPRRMPEEEEDQEMEEMDSLLDLSIEIDDFFDRHHSEETEEHKERVDESLEDAIYPDDAEHAEMEEEMLLTSVLY